MQIYCSVVDHSPSGDVRILSGKYTPFGPYVELFFGAWHGPVYPPASGSRGEPKWSEVINVWDDFKGMSLLNPEYSTYTPGYGLDHVLIQWMRSQDRDNPEWYFQYLRNQRDS